MLYQLNPVSEMNNNSRYILIYIILIFNLTVSCQTNKKENTMSDHKYTNKLINEKSPYLQQHAHNPVNWYPWGEEAFEKARRENKPIFLSIGYSTCHWCHVMEHESFEDTTVARLMNEVFVSIKVDREERPDIDNIYMTVCQIMIGSGGWPLTIIMTPDKKPFFAGTYFPKETKYGRIGMIDLIQRIRNVWNEKHSDVIKSAEQITAYLHQTAKAEAPGELTGNILDEAFNDFENRFDEQYGGFGTRPKFPTPHNLLFLLRYWNKTNNQKALDMVTKTLTEMAKGGIYDHIGFGFHRYSTDEKWFLPHFEKMLYDQALLAIAYSEAFQATRNQNFKKTATEIFEYVLRDMKDKDGSFYSAEDADSENEEGKFYVWSAAKIDKLLPENDAKIFKTYFGVTPEGNYYDEASRSATGKNILHISISLDELSKKTETGIDELEEIIANSKKKLFEYREKRIHPHKDTKVLTDWNGLMIAALAKGARILNKPEFLTHAEDAAQFILSNLTANGKLLHRYKDGEAKIQGNLDDYAFFCWGLLELYESTLDPKYLKEAINITENQIKDFWDTENGGFFFTSENAEELLVRTKELYDGAVPSGNSVSFLNLIRLSKLTADNKFEDYAFKLSKAFAGKVKKSPVAYTQFLSAQIFAFGPSFEIVITGKRNDARTKEILDELHQLYIPEKVVLLVSGENREEIIKLAPFTKDYPEINNAPTIYVCKNFVCSLPTNSIDEMKKLLAK